MKRLIFYVCLLFALSKSFLFSQDTLIDLYGTDYNIWDVHGFGDNALVSAINESDKSWLYICHNSDSILFSLEFKNNRHFFQRSDTSLIFKEGFIFPKYYNLPFGKDTMIVIKRRDISKLDIRTFLRYENLVWTDYYRIDNYLFKVSYEKYITRYLRILKEP